MSRYRENFNDNGGGIGLTNVLYFFIAFLFIWFGMMQHYELTPKNVRPSASDAQAQSLAGFAPQGAPQTVVPTVQRIADPHPQFCTSYRTRERRDQVTEFVQRYASVAQAEQKKYGIPASVKLGQGILETAAGTSRLCRENSNYFGIKCFSRKCKKGHCSNHTDDTHKDFFRIYNSAWESFREHSLFLRNGKRYRPLFDLETTDYRAWCVGLKSAGYATDERYDRKLIWLIEEFGLTKFDHI